MDWAFGLPLVAGVVLAAWLSIWSPSWVPREAAAWARLYRRLGAAVGICCGLWGTIVGGILAPNGIAHGAGRASGALLLGCGIGMMLGGAAHAKAGRPQHMSLPYLICGGTAFGLLGILLPVIDRLYP